jgi:hypothetical protein
MAVSPVLAMFGPAEIVLVLLVFVVPYFIPTIIAATRHKQNTGAIFALNLFLGWTVIGWVVSLVWALVQDNPRVVVSYTPGATMEGSQDVQVR